MKRVRWWNGYASGVHTVSCAVRIITLAMKGHSNQAICVFSLLPWNSLPVTCRPYTEAMQQYPLFTDGVRSQQRTDGWTPSQMQKSDERKMKAEVVGILQRQCWMIHVYRLCINTWYRCSLPPKLRIHPELRSVDSNKFTKMLKGFLPSYIY